MTPLDLSDADYDTDPDALDPTSEVDALTGANRHLRAVARIRHEIDVLTRVYQAEQARLQDRLGARVQMLEEHIAWHLRPVRQLHDRLLEADPKRKTIELPHGALKMRVSVKPRVFIDDQAALVAWAEDAAPEVLPAPTRVNVTDLREQVDVIHHADGEYRVVMRGTGEIVPHVHAEIPPPTWTADTNTESEI